MAAKKQSTSRAKRFSQKEIDEMLEEEREKVRQETLKEAEEKFVKVKEDYDIPEMETPSLGFFSQSDDGDDYEDPEESFLNDAETELNFDIFSYIEEKIIPKGVPIAYQIRRGGAYLGEYPHPFSWDLIKKQFGGGLYTVVARHALKKTYVKKQTLQVDGEAKNPDQKSDEPRQYIPPMPQQPDIASLMGPLLEFVRSTQESASREGRTVEREERKQNEMASNNMAQLLTTMQTANQNLFQQMQQSTMTLMEKMNEASQKMYERINDKFDRQMEALSKDKEKGLSTFELIKMLNDAKKEGRQDMQMLFDMLDERAAEKAAEGTEDSKIGKLISSMLPLVQMGVQNAQRAPQMHPQQARIAPQQRPMRQAPPSNSPQSFSMVKKHNVQTPVKKAEPVKHKPSVQDSKNSEHMNGLNRSKTAEEIMREATPEQIKICEIAIPLIVPYLDGSPKDAAMVVLAEFEKVGINQELLMKHFNFDFLWQIAKSFNIGNDKKSWFEEFYADIQDPTGDVISGEEAHTESL